MRRSFSLAMGLVLIVAMLGVQASVSVLAQSTPVATPGAGGYQIDTLAYSKGVGPGGNFDLALIDFTVNIGSELPEAHHLPSALFEVDSGYIRVTQTDGATIWVHIGKNGTPITNGKGTETYCTIETSKNGWCPLETSDKWDVVIGPGSSISLTNSSFTVQGVPEPKILTGSAPVEGFQGGGDPSGKGSILQSSNACYICPWPY